MIILHDPVCAEYGDDTHPERRRRVLATAQRLRERHPGWEWRGPGTVDEEALLLAHTRTLLTRLREEKPFDEDTPWFAGCYEHACRSVAAALGAAQLGLREGRRAFSLMRPPGHHATASLPMGFCYLNQVAVAAFAARAWGAQRVAIWDIDAHHGNGTEAILEGRPGFLFCSVHQFPGYPGTGTRNSHNCLNWAIPPHASREPHLDALRASWRAIVDFRPDFVLVSAGFDAHVRDPVGPMSLELEDFHAMGCWLNEAPFPVSCVLEGGYGEELPELVDAFLCGWEGEPPASLPAP